MRREALLPIAIVLIIIGLAIVGIVIVRPNFNRPQTNASNSSTTRSAYGVARFTSAEEFATYVQRGAANSVASRQFSTESALAAGLGQEDTGTKVLTQPSAAPGVDRVSTTNVQVAGIDEPDIVKTDGLNLFVSNEEQYVYADGPMPLVELKQTEPDTSTSSSAGVASDIIGEEIAPARLTGQTRVLKAFPADALAKIASIAKGGTLLLDGTALMVFTNDAVVGYNVGQPAAPEQRWSIEQSSGTERVDARLNKGVLYLVTRTSIVTDRPCPYEPLSAKGTALPIPCTDIYHPVTEVPVDSTYTVLAIDPETGVVKRQASFVGTYGSSVMAMFDQSLYLTYSYTKDTVELVNGFIAGPGRDLFPDLVREKLRRLQTYDLSSAAKMAEFEVITQSFLATLSDDARMRFESELSNSLNTYTTEHSRELEQTGIVKVDLQSFGIDGTGTVPGSPLNQFSLDEYNDTLRIATTVGGRFGFGSGTSTNDVYLLDSSLNISGSVLDLGQGETIYGVRFIGDRGYVVTFKQTDPFYVLDLSNPKKPALSGELKIPGYSSYLHPLKDDLILGIGQEEGKVKLALYDVTDAAKPVERTKYLLDEYWSEASTNHRAFLQDAAHSVFFLPGSNGGYVFSHTDTTLELKSTVAGYSINRAVYINDLLYVIGTEKITVLDEKSWQTVKEVSY